MSEAKSGQHWRHKESGREVIVLGIGRMQSKIWCDEKYTHEPESGNPPSVTRDSVDMRHVVIYVEKNPESFYDVWVRPVEEFVDGRFEKL